MSRALALRRLLTGPVGLAVAFIAVHVTLSWINLTDTRYQMMWDVTVVYRDWMESWVQGGPRVGIDGPWVYPTLALAPMFAALVFGIEHYGLGWLVLVTVLNGLVLIPLHRRSLLAAWWWIGFTAALGPIALGRIDAPALSIAIGGVLLLATRPALASVLLTVAAWIKIWPAALVMTAVAAGYRSKRVLAGAVATSSVVVLVALAAGAGGNVLSAVTTQTGRGLQVEAPAALPWMWLAHFRPDLAITRFNAEILTWEAAGPGAGVAASLMNPVLAAGVVLVLVLAWRARRAGAEPLQVAAVSSLGLVGVLVAMNKVGSPQYMTWLVAPLLLGQLVDRHRFRVPAILALVLAGLTQAIYPWAYGDVLGTSEAMLVVLTARNVLELGLLGWALLALRRRAPMSSVSGASPAVEVAHDGRVTGHEQIGLGSRTVTP